MSDERQYILLPECFDGLPVHKERYELGLPTCTPAKPGTGPVGQTCKTCKFYRRVKYRDYVYLKCGAVEEAWTHGAATDIKAKWPACSSWEGVRPPAVNLPTITSLRGIAPDLIGRKTIAEFLADLRDTNTDLDTPETRK